MLYLLHNSFFTIMIPLIVPALKRVFLQFFLSILLFQGIFCSAEENFTLYNWPRFRGLNGDGISGCTHWDPTMIENELKILWKTNVGAGYSNVILKGKLLYTLGNKNGKD